MKFCYHKQAAVVWSISQQTKQSGPQVPTIDESLKSHTSYPEDEKKTLLADLIRDLEDEKKDIMQIPPFLCVPRAALCVSLLLVA